LAIEEKFAGDAGRNGNSEDDGQAKETARGREPAQDAGAPSDTETRTKRGKSEIRISKSETNPKLEARNTVQMSCLFGASDFEFVSDFGFRASDFFAAGEETARS
jgi:hypothetical protein